MPPMLSRVGHTRSGSSRICSLVAPTQHDAAVAAVRVAELHLELEVLEPLPRLQGGPGGGVREQSVAHRPLTWSRLVRHPPFEAAPVEEHDRGAPRRLTPTAQARRAAAGEPVHGT